MSDNGLGCVEGTLSAISIVLVVGFAIWLIIKVIEHWEEVTQWIYSAGFTR
jgi:ABC-type nickel/cobalt efflux system permease component RcnA